ncbi:flavin reductase family protein [bacterium]|nr:MAG: flavin reductase family protein [bacterium]
MRRTLRASESHTGHFSTSQSKAKAAPASATISSLACTMVERWWAACFIPAQEFSPAGNEARGMNLVPSERPWQDIYQILIDTVLPRPIAWVSTLGLDGERNLAPFSFFMPVTARPMTLAFAPMRRGHTPEVKKDTLRNIEASGEFVVNVVTRRHADAAHHSAHRLPIDADEFERAGVSAAPSIDVAPPRVAESPVSFECVAHRIVDLGDEAGSGHLVIGRVVRVHLADELLDDRGRVVRGRLEPVGLVGADDYLGLDGLFELVRHD